jgi:uncharacterized protein with PIN domain
MPGQLKESARCPECNTPLLMLSDLTNSAGVMRSYYHQRDGRRRRKRYCQKFFTDHEEAQRARRTLETRRYKQRPN